MFKFFFKPQIKATLIKGGSQVKMKIRNATREQTMILMYLTVRQVAKALKMQERELMNKIIDLDKTIIKSQKLEQKEAYKNKHHK
jgi:hypothetical protein